MIRNEPHLPMLCERSDEEYSFHPGKTFADATPRPAPERKIRELRSAFTLIRCPALGLETQWLVKITFVAMHNVLTHQNERLLWYKIAANLAIVNCQTANGPGRRIKPHRLSKYHLRIFQLRHICKGCQP